MSENNWPGSVADNDKTVRPDSSITVPVTSCRLSLDCPELPPVRENLVFRTNSTVTTASWFFLKIAFPFSPISSARANIHATERMPIDAKNFLFIVLSFLFFPGRFQFQKRRVNPPQHFHYHERFLVHRDLFHD